MTASANFGKTRTQQRPCECTTCSQRWLTAVVEGHKLASVQVVRRASTDKCTWQWCFQFRNRLSNEILLSNDKSNDKCNLDVQAMTTQKLLADNIDVHSVMLTCSCWDVV